MGTRPREYCCACDAPTGRAGQGEDSLHTDSGDLGPYCEDCWGDVEFWRGYADKLRNQTEVLLAALKNMGALHFRYDLTQQEREEKCGEIARAAGSVFEPVEPAIEPAKK